MKRTAILLAALVVATAANAAPVRTATEAYVTNKIAAAVAALPAPDFTTNNTALVDTIQAKAPAPDFTTNNTVLVETIETTAPAPGNYSAVSNAAMRAAAQTNDFLRLSGGKMVGDIDMGGQHGAAGVEPIDSAFLRFMEFVFGYGELGSGFGIYRINGDSLRVEYLFNGDNEYGTEFDVMRRMELDAVAAAATNYTDRAISAIPAGVTPGAVTNIVNDAIRAQSLGGIWDAQLEVWWTPVMSNGALTYQATTNVNLNAEN